MAATVRGAMVRGAMVRPMVLSAMVLLCAAAAAAQEATPRLVVTAGRSLVVESEWDVARIAVTDPAVADAIVVEPREVLIDGKAPGTISFLMWGRGGERAHYELVVERPVPPLAGRLFEVFPGEAIEVVVGADVVVLTGDVSSPTVVRRAGELAAAAAGGAKVVNMLQVRPAAGSRQVMLQVRFGEIRHNLLTEAGLALFTGASGARDVVGRLTTQQFAAPAIDGAGGAAGLTFSDFLNVFVFSREHNVGALLKALQTRGLFQTLAEPTLLAYDGQEASFLAGGEIPVPIVQGLTNSVSVQYKEYGIRLTFTPTIDGDLVHLQVRPEVSTLDFANGVTLSGFRIPALSTRRADTRLELRDGQSFAIAGLLDNVSQLVRQKVPGLGDLPIIGPLFRSRGDRRERTELLVVITPTLIRPTEAVGVPAVPGDPSRFLGPEPE